MNFLCHLKRIFVVWAEIDCRLSNFYTSVDESCYFLQKHRFCATASDFELRVDGNLCELAKEHPVVKTEAQSVLRDYFHSTRGLQFLDAENMSKNSPEFFDILTSRVLVNDSEVRRSLIRFLRYHPVNEFEPFFESIGLKPSEYSSYLPRNLMFLNEDELLLENYHVLCNYGISRIRIGKIYREATEFFQLESGVLKSRLQFFEDLGLKQPVVAKVIAATPYLLTGKMNREFIEFIETLSRLGVKFSCIQKHISLDDSYNWKRIRELVCFLNGLDFSPQDLKEMVMQHPYLLFEKSGFLTLSLVSFLLKFGSTSEDIRNALLAFPKTSLVKFITNLHNGYRFLLEIKMEVPDIGRVVRSHPTMLGSCALKKASSLLVLLLCSERTLCQLVKEDPRVLKKWCLRVKVTPLENETRVARVRKMRTKFLTSIGFIENTTEMERALKEVRGSAFELEERFNALLKAGLSRKEAIEMVKSSPQILNQGSEKIEAKIDNFVKELGYGLSDLITHPRILSYRIVRVKLRLLMYQWASEEGVVHPKLAMSYILSGSEQHFVSVIVNYHPKGLAYWEKLKLELKEE